MVELNFPNAVTIALIVIFGAVVVRWGSKAMGKSSPV